MEPVSLLSGWESFYVIVGSSAAGLTGLQFVVMTLIQERNAANARTIAAFGTPTVVHFGAVVLIAAVLSAPWHSTVAPGIIVGAAGTAGVAYAVITLRRMTVQRQYKPVLEDWVWHGILPNLAYATIAVSAFQLTVSPDPWLYFIGAAALLLLFIGIHNAWDTVAFLATGQLELQRQQNRERPHERKESDDPSAFV